MKLGLTEESLIIGRQLTDKTREALSLGPTDIFRNQIQKITHKGLPLHKNGW